MRSESALKSKCFVLMPFSNVMNLPEVWEDVIRDGAFGIAKLGARYQCLRADDVFDNRAIIEDIVRSIEDSDIIIADLTTRNPNVFYELGRAHEMHKECILIVQDIADVPFDLRHLRHLQYSTTARGLKDLEANLIKTVESIEARKLKARPSIEMSEKVRRASDRLDRLVEESRKVREELVEVPAKYADKYRQLLAEPDTGLVKLYPRHTGENHLDEMNLNYYSFTRRQHGWLGDVQISYDLRQSQSIRSRDSWRVELSLGPGGADYGFILPTQLDEIPMGALDLKTLKMQDARSHELLHTILDYILPGGNEPNVRAEQQRVSGLSIEKDGMAERIVPEIGSVYIIRSINWDESDNIYFLQYLGRELDETVILMWKIALRFPRPVFPREPRR